jgi:hypothetical protein
MLMLIRRLLLRRFDAKGDRIVCVWRISALGEYNLVNTINDMIDGLGFFALE